MRLGCRPLQHTKYASRVAFVLLKRQGPTSLGPATMSRACNRVIMSKLRSYVLRYVQLCGTEQQICSTFYVHSQGRPPILYKYAASKVQKG